MSAATFLEPELATKLQLESSDFRPCMEEAEQVLLALERLDGAVHDSDCATHNMPAMPNGECDCGLSEVTK